MWLAGKETLLSASNGRVSVCGTHSSLPVGSRANQKKIFDPTTTTNINVTVFFSPFASQMFISSPWVRLSPLDDSHPADESHSTTRRVVNHLRRREYSVV